MTFQKLVEKLLGSRMREGLFKNLKKIFLGGGCTKDFLEIRRRFSWEEDARRIF